MTAGGEGTREAGPRAETWLGFIAMCVGMFMAVLDIQIVATSLAEIQKGLTFPPNALSWIQTTYLIAEVIAIALTGLLTRALTLRCLFTIAAGVFVAASVGCASANALPELLAWRVVQGFAGGMLIPLVFSAVFLLFPGRGQRLATTIAGVLAVLAPIAGPVVGGYITATWSWHWLFLINVAPGVASIAVAALMLPRCGLRLEEVRELDWLSLLALATGLAALELGLKSAPHAGWVSPAVIGWLTLAATALLAFLRRSLSTTRPIVTLATFADRRFALGTAMSFILGISLYGSVYLMPVFLAYVGQLDALEVGETMLVTGAAQLVAAPLVIWLERHIDARTLAAFGFALLSGGLAMSTWDTPRTGFEEMLWPQVVRGVAIMFCLLPPTRIALGHLAPVCIPDASAMFNLMRNLGGAIGLALIDTVIFGRAEGHGLALAERLLRLEDAAFRFVGLPRPAEGTVITEQMKDMARPAVERAALTLAVCEAWAMIAALTLIGLALTLLVPSTRAADGHVER